MRVLWLAHAVPYPPKAGFLVRSYHLLRQLAQGHTVDVIAMIQEPWIRTLFPSVQEGLETSHRELSRLCRRVTFLPIEKTQRRFGKLRTAGESLLSGGSYTLDWLIGPETRKRVSELAKAGEYDLIHFDTIGLIGLRDCVGPARATLGHHNIESHMLWRRAENSGNFLARKYFENEARLVEAAERNTAAGFATHITCSELDNDRLRPIAPTALIQAVPNGVDCDFFQPMATDEIPQSLAFVGTMNWYPNIDAMEWLLENVWPSLLERRPGIKLDIVGSNPPDSLRKLADSTTGVSIHGYVPDVRPFFSRAALFVCPIRDGGGTKLKILDASAMGRCIVAHPIACEGIDTRDNENVIYATTAEEWVSRIDELLGEPQRRRHLGVNARKMAEEIYSYDAIGAKFRAVMESASGF